MLVRFDSKVGRVTMFGDVAIHLLKMMGHSGTVPGALLAADVPAALHRLERALEHAPSLPPKSKNERKVDDLGGDDGDEPPVSLVQRAFPLVQLLKEAATRKVDVMWAQEGSAPLEF